VQLTDFIGQRSFSRFLLVEAIGVEEEPGDEIAVFTFCLRLKQEQRGSTRSGMDMVYLQQDKPRWAWAEYMAKVRLELCQITVGGKNI